MLCALRWFDVTETCELGKDSEWMSDVYNNMGNTLLHETQYNAAIEWYNKAIAKAKESSHCGKLAKSLGNKGNCCYHQMQYGNAIEVYLHAVDIAGSINGR